jgi:hypothetical protein
MQYLKLSTASQTVILGPFVDDTDGKTAETGLTIANTDVKVVKHAGTSQTNKNSGGATHIASGYYYATLDATDTNTAGRLDIQVNMSGALPVWKEFMVLPAVVYDSLVGGTDTLEVDILQIGGNATAATNLYRAASGIVVAQAVTGSLAIGAFTTNLTEATNDHYIGRQVVFVSGVLSGQATNITDYDGTTKTLTVADMTDAPANLDYFVIV